MINLYPCFFLGKASDYTKNLRHFFTCVVFIAIAFSFTPFYSSGQATYPVLQRVVKPNPAPSAPGDSYSPPMSGNAANGTPAFAEWVRTAGADESVIATGIDFSRFTGNEEGKDTRFKVFGKNGMARDAKIQRVDGNKVVFTLDSAMGSWGMYLVWPGNENGYGHPAAINKTDAWWIGPERAVKGTITSVYGRNLSTNNDSTTSHVYIKPANGSGQWATVTKVNPYKVDFIVPASLANGNYEVWIHNGHGGEYGWSGPLTLTVQSATAWNSTVVNVRNYGATGNGTTDDTQAILSAINAAGNYSTVYFPAGTYIVSNTIYLKQNMRYRGDGKTASIIKQSPNFNSNSYGMLSCYQGGNNSNIEVSDMGFEGNSSFSSHSSPIVFRSGSDIKLRDLNFIFPGTGIGDFHLSNRVHIDNCLFVGGEAQGATIFLGNSSQLFMDSCVVKLTGDVQVGIASWGGNGVSMTNTHCEDYNNSNPADGSGWGLGRYFTGNGVWGSGRNTYLGHNTSRDLTVRLDPSVSTNQGEQFMWEGNYTVWTGFPSAATSNTVSVGGYTSSNDPRYIAIVQGRGLGQSRRIVSYSGGVITLDEPWNVIPDNSSRMVIGSYADRTAIYGNYLDGKSYAPQSETHIAAAGIEPFGGVFNFIADFNTLHELREGISNWCLKVNTDVGIQPNFFSVYVNNKLQKCRWAINHVDGNFNTALLGFQGTGIIGNVFRNNTITDAVRSGIIINQGYFSGISTYPVVDATVFESNAFNGVPVGFLSPNTSAIQQQIFLKNNFTRGGSGSPNYGVQLTARTILRSNNYSGFTNNYNGTPAAVTEAPYHVIELAGNPSAGPVDSIFTLFNSGSANLSWSVSENANWLTVSPVNGSISNERLVGAIQLSANPTGLTNGEHKAFITVTAGSQTRIYTVIFIITNGAPPPNQSPVADAGTDKIITLPTNSVVLTGGGTDPDGSIASFQWANISGPAQFTINSPSQAQTNVSNLVQGVYLFQLTVTDNLGAIGRDTVQVTVNPANQPPVANAGPNRTITLPTNSTSLNGSGSDPDGSVASYQWTKISGPTQFTIVSPTQAQTNVSNLMQGVYLFQLTVTDNLGAIGRDTVQVTVNAANQPPVANAGPNRTITLPTNSTSLNGSGSDPDGSVASYQWTKISGPTQFTINSPTQAQTNVSNLMQGVYLFQLTVTDNLGAIGRDTVQVTVNAANQPPVANAGPNRTITLPTNSTSLNGSGSDPDGSVASYQWTKISGPTQFTINSPTQAQTNVSNLMQGVYLFQLTVTDNLGAIGRDTVQVTVNAANQPPVANAGPNRTITLPTNSTSLNGSGSDPDGSVASYQWTKISGPTQFTIVSPTQAQTNVSNLMQGVYLFQLTVTDNLGAIGRDTVQVTVNAANQPPVANAGPNRTITLPTNSTSLSGSGSDPDGSVASYQWTKISGPTQFTINSPTQAQTNVSNLMQGVYLFQLTVTDNLGAIGRDTVQVAVNAANQPPVANAGPDRFVTLPTNSTSLLGSGSDPDGSVASFQWTKISGPAQFTINSPTQAQTNVSSLVQGVYLFQLTVTDNLGTIGRDTVQVTVNTANQPPVANAGTDTTIILPIDNIELNGSGFDPDGSVVTYRWAKIAGPSTYNIASPDQAQTTVTNLLEGVYKFELRVTDNFGAMARDTIEITVKPAIISSGARMYPNPATHIINIQIEGTTIAFQTSIRIFNAKGILVHQEQFYRSQQSITRQIDISKYATGTYFVEVGVDMNQRKTLILVKM